MVGSTADSKAELKAHSTAVCWVDWKADLWVGLTAVESVVSKVVSWVDLKVVSMARHWVARRAVMRVCLWAADSVDSTVET